MYFCISAAELTEFRYRYQISPDIWINTHYELTLDNFNFFGYRLGEHGGNFVGIQVTDNIQIDFSFYKDFTIGYSEGVHLTNIPNYITTPYSSTLTQVKIYKDLTVDCIFYNRIKECLTTGKKVDWDVVVDQVEKKLLSNLLDCCIEAPPRISYSGGLDSSTLAYLAKKYNINFTAVVSNSTNKYFKNLPFECEYQNLTTRSFKFAQDLEIIKPSFYNVNNLITGYYGDSVLLHHGGLYAQSYHLVDSTNWDLYDTAIHNNNYKFDNEVKLRFGILALHTKPMFHHWFGDFQILDPYRDPELLLLVMSLSLDDLIMQLGTARLQKQLIKQWDPSYLDNIFSHKNNYDNT